MVTFCVGVMTSPTPSIGGTADQLPSSDRSLSSDHKGLTGHPSKASSPCSNPSPASSSLSTPAVSSQSTPQAPPNTPIAEFLVYPTPIRKTKLEATSRSARVLTSAESRLLLKEKERKKKEEEEEKARRKSKREEKRVAREEEKKKLEEREARKAEQTKKKSEKQSEKQNKAKGKRNPVEYLVPALSGNKRKLPGGFSGSVKTYPKRKRMDPKSNQETNEDVCCVCFGLYKDDVNKSNCEWIQCSSEDCGIWIHVCCLEETDGGYVCAAKVYLCNHFRILCLIQL